MSYFHSMLRACAVGSLLNVPAVLAAALPEEAESVLPAMAEQQRLIAAAVRAEVQTQLTAARHTSDPAQTLQTLKLTADRVARTPELDAQTRRELRQELETAIRETSRRAAADAERAAEAHARRAAALDHERTLERLGSQQTRLEQLLDRFASLLAEERYALSESMADEIGNTAPNSALAAAARADSRLAQAARENLATRLARQQGIVQTLAQSESSAVPQPDDQPIVYPRAEVWEELSQRRRQYALVDLRKQSPAEQRINKALSETTELSFITTPLRDVLDTLKDMHGIEIQIHVPALQAAGLNEDTPVTKVLKGVSLRSALRLMLTDLDLTYVIKNEVLLVTTPEEAGRELVNKVYPVEQLVVPIRSTGFTGGFGQMGGFNSGGGQNMNQNGPMPGQNFNFNGPNANGPGPGFF